MATVRDTLETLVNLIGGPRYAQEMEGLSKKLLEHGEAVDKAKERSHQLKDAFSELGGESLIALGELAGYTAILKESVQAFAEEEQAIFRTTLLLKNLHSELSIGEVKEFAEGIKQSTSFSDKQIISLIGLEKQFGIADKDVQSLTKSLLDFAKGNARGFGLDVVANASLKAINGQTMMLRRMGITIEDTGDKAKNLVQVQQKLNELFGGSAAAERNTLAGSFDALRASLEELFEAVGDKLSTVLVPVLNAVIKIIDYLTDHVYLFTAALGAAIGGFFGGPVGAILGGIAGLGVGFLPSRQNPAEQIAGGKGGLATEDTLSKIESNTKNTHDALIQGVLGGSGAIARESLGWRDIRMAFGI